MEEIQPSVAVWRTGDRWCSCTEHRTPTTCTSPPQHRQRRAAKTSAARPTWLPDEGDCIPVPKLCLGVSHHRDEDSWRRVARHDLRRDEIAPASRYEHHRPTRCRGGDPAKEYYNVKRTALEVDITPNRVDAASHMGARPQRPHRLASPVVVKPSVDAFTADKTDGGIGDRRGPKPVPPLRSHHPRRHRQREPDWLKNRW